MAFSRWLYLILTITIKHHLQQQKFYCKHPGFRPAKLPENGGTVQKMSGQRPVYQTNRVIEGYFFLESVEGQCLVCRVSVLVIHVVYTIGIYH